MARPDRWTLRAVAVEAGTAVARRWRRASFTVAAVVLGVASVVTTAGITTSAAAQVSDRFDRYLATEVTLRRRPSEPFGPNGFPADTTERLRQLVGVESGGPLCRWGSEAIDLRRPWDGDLASRPSGALTVSLSPGAQAAAGIAIRQGRNFEPVDHERGLPVALLSAGAAVALGDPTVGAVVYANGVPVTVVGIFDATERRRDLLTAFVLPSATAAQVGGPTCPEPGEVVIATAPGAAEVVRQQAPLAVLPSAPHEVEASALPDPAGLRGSVQGDVGRLAVALAVVALAMSTITIANSATVSVLERTREVGVLRALGASRRTVRAQFLLESTITGAVGGGLGAVAGTVAVLVVSIVNRWLPVLDLRVPAAGVALGAVAGALGGLWPAHRAARIPPADALRR